MSVEQKAPSDASIAEAFRQYAAHAHPATDIGLRFAAIVSLAKELDARALSQPVAMSGDGEGSNEWAATGPDMNEEGDK